MKKEKEVSTSSKQHRFDYLLQTVLEEFNSDEEFRKSMGDDTVETIDKILSRELSI